MTYDDLLIEADVAPCAGARIETGTGKNVSH